MRQKPLNILIAAVLAGLFTIFNVGLPFVLYVCPMMAGAQCACTCSQSTSDGPALTYVHTPCCNSHVVAERNTTPFLGSDKSHAHHFEVSYALPTQSDYQSQTHQLFCLSAFSNTGPPPPDTPPYLLSSSLLL